MGLIVAPERFHHSHLTLLAVPDCRKHRKVVKNDVPTRNTVVGHVGGGGGLEVHRGGESYCEQLQRQIPCPECEIELTAGSMMAHQIRMHGTDIEIYRNQLSVIQTEHPPQVYDNSIPKSTMQCPFPLPRLPGSYRTWNGPRNHFNQQHWGDSIRILEEHPSPLPKCNYCESQVLSWCLKSLHYELEKCRLG